MEFRCWVITHRTKLSWLGTFTKSTGSLMSFIVNWIFWNCGFEVSILSIFHLSILLGKKSSFLFFRHTSTLSLLSFPPFHNFFIIKTSLFRMTIYFIDKILINVFVSLRIESDATSVTKLLKKRNLITLTEPLTSSLNVFNPLSWTRNRIKWVEITSWDWYNIYLAGENSFDIIF